MSDFVTRIRQASTWQEYYNAYKNVYRHLFEERWALGAAGFAYQLHHTAIPDVTGMTAGSLNWAAYSQPSPQSLKAFLPIFRDLLQSEPHRIRSNRYFFFVAEDPPLSREDVMTALGDLGNLVDFWCGSLEKALSLPEQYTLPLGLDALLGGTWLDDLLSSKPPYSKDSPLDFLRYVHESAIRHLPIKSSIAPLLIRRPLVDSFFILMAFQLHIDPRPIVDIIGEHSGISAFIASDRARAANWKHEIIGYCYGILDICPPRFVEYIVEPGDILSRIVRKHFEMPFERLWPLIRVLNPEISNPNRILAGQRIRLPDLSIAKSENCSTL